MTFKIANRCITSTTMLKVNSVGAILTVNWNFKHILQVWSYVDGLRLWSLSFYHVHILWEPKCLSQLDTEITYSMLSGKNSESINYNIMFHKWSHRQSCKGLWDWDFVEFCIKMISMAVCQLLKISEIFCFHCLWWIMMKLAIPGEGTGWVSSEIQG